MPTEGALDAIARGLGGRDVPPSGAAQRGRRVGGHLRAQPVRCPGPGNQALPPPPRAVHRSLLPTRRGLPASEAQETPASQAQAALRLPAGHGALQGQVRSSQDRRPQLRPLRAPMRPRSAMSERTLRDQLPARRGFLPRKVHFRNQRSQQLWWLWPQVRRRRRLPPRRLSQRLPTRLHRMQRRLYRPGQ
jgi:hypothetical protein